MSLNNFNFNNKRALVRCDFNVPMEDGKILDDFKIQQTISTINFITKNNGKAILISHLGRPKSAQFQSQRMKYSLRPIQQRLTEILKEKVIFVDKCIGRKPERIIKKAKSGSVILLENLRFHKQEQENDKKFASALSRLGDVYINEAFSVCHRKHASVDALPIFLEHLKGLSLEKEIEVLSRIIGSPERPMVGIIGGAKIATKIKVIEKFMDKADYILLGGRLINMILRVKGLTVGREWPEEDIVKKIKKISLTNPKLRLPVDALVSPDRTGDIYIRETGPGSIRKDEGLFDIGSETIETFMNVIKQAKTIFWSGPMGLFENEKFSRGTKYIAKAIADNHDAFTVAGGGDTVLALKKFDLMSSFCHISTGGGSMLAFLAGEEMPGLDALNN